MCSAASCALLTALVFKAAHPEDVRLPSEAKLRGWLHDVLDTDRLEMFPEGTTLVDGRPLTSIQSMSYYSSLIFPLSGVIDNTRVASPSASNSTSTSGAAGANAPATTTTTTGTVPANTTTATAAPACTSPSGQQSGGPAPAPTDDAPAAADGDDDPSVDAPAGGAFAGDDTAPAPGADAPAPDDATPAGRSYMSVYYMFVHKHNTS